MTIVTEVVEIVMELFQKPDLYFEVIACYSIERLRNMSKLTAIKNC